MIVSKDLFHWLVVTGKILVSPFMPQDNHKSRRPSRLSPVLTPDEAVKVLESCIPDTVLGLRDRAILELLYSTGIRKSDLVHLNESDFSFETRELVIVNGKGEKDRLAPVGEYALHFTEDYLRLIRPWQVKAKTEKALFVGNWEGTGLAGRTIVQIVEKALYRAVISSLLIVS